MDFSKWKLDQVVLSKLKLDPENPRIGSVRRLTQPELIGELLKSGRVFDLARDIARQGFMPTETLVAIKSGLNLIVVEGNRRLAALKILSNPDLAPEEFRKRVRSLVDNQKFSLPAKLPVTIAPSRESTIPLVFEKHRGKTIESWTTVMQARYIAGVIDGGVTVDEAFDVYGLDRGDVVRGLWEARLYEVVRSLDLPDDAQDAVRNIRTFPFTTLTRLFETSVVQAALGVKLDEQVGFKVVEAPEIFKEKLAAIVTDIVNEKVSSRTHNTVEQISDYLSGRFPKGSARKKPSDGAPASDFIDPAKLSTEPEPKPRKKAKKAPPQSISIVPRGFVCDVEDTRIVDIFVELKNCA